MRRNQVLDEIEMFFNLIINRNLTQSDIDKTDVRSKLEQQVQNEESKDSGWRFDTNYSMTIYF